MIPLRGKPRFKQRVCVREPVIKKWMFILKYMTHGGRRAKKYSEIEGVRHLLYRNAQIGIGKSI